MNVALRRMSFLVAAAGVLLLCQSLSAHENCGLEMNLQYDSLDKSVFTWNLKGFDQQTVRINGQEHLLLAYGHCAYVVMDRTGFPQIPMSAYSLMIPDSAQMEANVIQAEYYDIRDVHVAPYKGVLPRTVDPATVGYVFNDVYLRDEWFPKNIVNLRDPYILRSVRGQVVEYVPFQYNPVKKILRVYTSVEAEVKTNGNAVVNVLDAKNIKADRSFYALYKNHFVNFMAGNRGDPPDEDGDLLVICHGPFMTAMQPFVDWKNSIGINTTMVNVSTIGNNSTAIKNYVKTLYGAGDLAFVLLVGDSNEVKSGSYQGGLSDAFYSTITADWYPDLFVGRFSASSLSQLQTQVERTLAYEDEEHDVSLGGWHAMGMGVASNQGAGYGHYGESDDTHADLIRDELLAYGFSKVDRIYDYFGTKAMITNGLNEGRRCVNYTGHGSTTSWGTTGFSNSDVGKLNNAGMLPFISSVACVNGAFSYGTCFAEAWMRSTKNGKPIGAIACYMSSVNQSWAPPMYGQGNHQKSNKYGGAERFWMESQWSIAGQWYGGSCCMMDLAGSAGRQEFMNWILFGDPSLRTIGTAGIKTLTASSSSVPINNAVDIDFTVKPGAIYAGYDYFLLGSVTGTSPGLPLPGGLILPLNYDVFMGFILANPNSSMFQSFFGTLDGQGVGTATFDTTLLVPIDPRLVGVPIYFAAVISHNGNNPEFVTNVKKLTISN